MHVNNTNDTNSISVDMAYAQSNHAAMYNTGNKAVRTLQVPSIGELSFTESAKALPHFSLLHSEYSKQQKNQSSLFSSMGVKVLPNSQDLWFSRNKRATCLHYLSGWL